MQYRSCDDEDERKARVLGIEGLGVMKKAVLCTGLVDKTVEEKQPREGRSCKYIEAPAEVDLAGEEEALLPPLPLEEGAATSIAFFSTERMTRRLRVECGRGTMSHSINPKGYIYRWWVYIDTPTSL